MIGLTRRCAASLPLLVIATLSRLNAQAPPKPQGPPPSVCPDTPVNRQLDFWIGHWDVAPWNSPAGTPPATAGTSIIEPDVSQCVISESWRGAAGGTGKSINFYDVNRKAWRQVWVASGGGSLDYSGEFRDGAMRFEGWTLGAAGQRVLQRLTFTPFGKDTVRQTFSTSTDDGTNWVTGFDARYVRQAAMSPATAATYRSPTGSTLRLMLSDANLGPEISVGEITFPPNADSGDHAHGAIEILYVLSGRLEHFVNGKAEILTAGMTGYVRPPDKIRHKTCAEGAKVLVMWVPGYEANRIIARWQKEP
jgi:quercetin dioxygenase-like cupin family protein